MLIGELAERTGVSRRALRYYEEQGLLVPARSSNGYRSYDDGAVLVVAQVQGMFALGLDSEAVRRFLGCASGERPRLAMCPELRAHLEARERELAAEAAAIARRRTRLAEHLAPVSGD